MQTLTLLFLAKWLVVERPSPDGRKKFTRPMVVKAVNDSPFWSVTVDESTDSATMEQLGVYVRYLNLEKGKISEDFLEMKRIVGHPNASNIFSSLMEVLNELPVSKLSGFTSDGASVMICDKQDVLGTL